jgi:hypothetical protein
MSGRGQTEKNSVRAYVFRFALQTRTLLDAVGMSQRCQTTTSRTEREVRVHQERHLDPLILSTTSVSFGPRILI